MSCSGKRKITLMGSHLEFAEAVRHSKVQQEVRLPTVDSQVCGQTLAHGVIIYINYVIGYHDMMCCGSTV